MIPRPFRIPRSIFPFRARKKHFQGEYFTLLLSPSDPHTGFRCSVVVPKKVVKQAVERNTLRRKVYAVVSGLVPEHTREALYVIRAKKGAERLSFDEIQADVTVLFKKAYNTSI